MDRIAFYSGLFDPFTRGHLNVVIRTLRECSRIIIGVENNSNCTFSAQTRIQMVHQSVYDLINYSCGSSQFREEVAQRIRENPEIIEVVAIRGEVVDEAIRHGAHIMVRGVRNDYDVHLEEEIADRVRLQFRIRNYPLEDYRLEQTNGEVVHMSSTVTKQLCDCGEYIAALHHVTPSVHNMLMQHYLKEEFDKMFPHQENLWRKLCQAYGCRRYRNFSHVAYMLNRLAIEIALKGQVDCEQRLKQAMFLLDIGDNPQASAQWVGENLFIDEVVKIIKEADYAHHTPEYSTLVRCDLLILTDEENYPLYRRLLQSDNERKDNAGLYEGLHDVEKLQKTTGIFSGIEFENVHKALAKAKKKRL